MKALVVGGGVMGVALAYELACHRVEVVLLERGELGSGASGAAAGMLTPLGDFANRRAIAPLATECLGATSALVERLADDGEAYVELERRGALRIATDEEQAAALRGWIPVAGGPFALEWLEPSAVLALTPRLTCPVVGALWSPSEGQLSPKRYVAALARAAIRRGATIRQFTPVLRVMIEHGQATGVVTPEGTFGADHVVIAAGAWSTSFGLSRVPFAPPVRGQMISVTASESLLGTISLAFGRYFLPKPDGSIWIGATEEEAGFDDSVTPDGLAWLSVAAGRLISELGEARVTRMWAGLRPGTPDGVPLLGPVPGVSRLSLATGFTIGGVMYAAIAAQLLAREIVGQGAQTPLAPCRPERLTTGEQNA
jgi:glycine oxidase